MKLKDLLHTIYDRHVIIDLVGMKPDGTCEAIMSCGIGSYYWGQYYDREVVWIVPLKKLSSWEDCFQFMRVCIA